MPPIGSYLSQAEFARCSTMSDEAIIELEARYPGFLDRRLVLRSGEISSRLIKRYAVPLDMLDPPSVLVKWLVDLVTFDAFMKLGFNGGEGADGEIAKEKDLALEQIREAADAQSGLYELPLRASEDGSGITKSGPLAYSESSPYTAAKNQRREVSYGHRRRRFW